MFMEVIVIFKAVDDLLSMKWKPGLITRIYKSSVNDVKSIIISLSLLLFNAVVSIALQSCTYMTQMYLFPLLEVVGKRPYRSEQIFPYLVLIGYTAVQKTSFVLILSSKYVSGGFYLVDCSPCLLIFRCAIVAFLELPRCFFMSFSVRPVHVFRKPCLIALRILAVVELKSAACKYRASSGFEVCAIMLCTTFFDCCVPRGTSHIPVFLFLDNLIIYSPLL